jgi:hypothetical protein
MISKAQRPPSTVSVSAKPPRRSVPARGRQLATPRSLLRVGSVSYRSTRREIPVGAYLLGEGLGLEWLGGIASTPGLVIVAGAANTRSRSAGKGMAV